jgi:hypothetical protein
MLALDSSGQPSSGDNWDWEPAKSLTHIVDLGLEFPRRAFSVYLNPQDASLAGATLAFDVDNAVIFGVSIDDEGARAENRERAKTVLYEMAQMLGATRGFIGVEEPPPLRGAQERPAILVYSWPIAWLTCNRRLTHNRKYLRVHIWGSLAGLRDGVNFDHRVHDNRGTHPLRRSLALSNPGCGLPLNASSARPGTSDKPIHTPRRHRLSLDKAPSIARPGKPPMPFAPGYFHRFPTPSTAPPISTPPSAIP